MKHAQEILRSLTPASAELYIRMIGEAQYENYYNNDNYDKLALCEFTKTERGNLSDLKKKGLVETFDDPDVPGYLWVEFTDAELATYVDEIVTIATYVDEIASKVV